MWFLFGLITSIGFAAYFGYPRYRAAWKGEPGVTGGIRFVYKVLKHRGSAYGLLIGIPAQPGFDYSLKRETAMDRFFKSIGMAEEHQIGNEHTWRCSRSAPTQSTWRATRSSLWAKQLAARCVYTNERWLLEHCRRKCGHHNVKLELVG